ncbi:MAG: glycine cleavage T C-terminal barrel domain-containing protein [Rhizomicrobium sp.]
MSLIRATPFHARTSAANRLNAWTNRNGWTLAAHYGDPAAEALAARLTAIVADISWRWRVMIEGVRTEEFLSRLLTRDPARLEPGQAFKALWLTDRGGVRGAGAIARLSPDAFRLVATESDLDWIARGAALFDVRVREIGEEEGGLAIIGPYARNIAEAAGLDATLEALNFRTVSWRGLDVTLSRFGEHGGYELWCKADDALLVWNRIAKAAEPFAFGLAGTDAMDVLDLEAGVPRPGRDYQAARKGFAAQPTPAELGLLSLIDNDHLCFNGRAAFLLAARRRTLIGVEFKDETPAPHAALTHGCRRVGETMNSLYSPALHRAIALATADVSVSARGTLLMLPQGAQARVVSLPFLPIPDSITK